MQNIRSIIVTEDLLQQIPLELQLNIHRIGKPEASRWVEYYQQEGVWPTTEQAYKIRYERGDLREIPFRYFRKFVLHDLNLSDFEKENLFLEQRGYEELQLTYNNQYGLLPFLL